MGAISPLPKDLDLTQVKGVRVEARQTAKMPLFGKALDNQAGSTHAEILGVDEVLLANGAIVYQCVQRPNGCGLTFDNVKSASAHLGRHRGRGALRRYEETIEQLRAEVTELRRSNTALKAAAARKATAAKVAKAAAPKAEQNGHGVVDPGTLASAEEIEKRLDAALGQLRLSALSALALAKAQAPDPELVRKAAEFDRLAAVFTPKA